MKKNIILLSLLLGVAASLAAQTRSPYINKVYEYCPAPGQFINEAPEYEPGDSHDDIVRKVEEYIANNERGLISLGGYGGYIIFGFDHPVMNVKGKNDFQVLGNAFAPTENSGSGELNGGSSEPGIVMVSYDANGNGIPDDEWYELAGSEYNSEQTSHDYTITYYKPDPDKEPVLDPDDRSIIDDTYIRWTDSQSNEGYVKKNRFHTQSYWPEWMSDKEEMVYSGSRVADNYTIITSDNSKYYLQKPYAWGYADNQPNDANTSEFNIEWAVDKEGKAVHLPAVHFIKVYTAINQHCGHLGESSTEIAGAIDLHPEENPVSIPQTHGNNSIELLTNPVRDQLIVASTESIVCRILNLQGNTFLQVELRPGTNHIDCSHLPSGIYLFSAQGIKTKFIKGK